jgi:L-serine/L-threonine ammonia-lyase
MTVPLDATVLPPTGGVPTAAKPAVEPLHAVTPLIYSQRLSTATGQHIWLKLDCDQPSGSFKIRGVGKICQSAITRYGSATRIVTSSGGNAGLAAAHAASSAGVASTIYVPASTEADVVAKLRSLGAHVVVGGDSWDQADAAARKLVDETQGAVYVHPFVGEELVAGHSGLADEVYDQLHAQGAGELDAIVCSVGGGGLLRGIMQGAARYAGAKPALVAVQNFGVNSFNRSLDDHRARGEATLPEDVVTLAAIESKCTSMGTKRCSLETVQDAIRYDGDVTTLTVTDNLSASACWQFSATSAELEADGRTRLVELSCASALTPVFHTWILDALIARTPSLARKHAAGSKLNLVFEVCGGSKVNAELLASYKSSAGTMDQRDRIRINGQDIPPSA